MWISRATSQDAPWRARAEARTDLLPTRPRTGLNVDESAPPTRCVLAPHTPPRSAPYAPPITSALCSLYARRVHTPSQGGAISTRSAVTERW